MVHSKPSSLSQSLSRWITARLDWSCSGWVQLKEGVCSRAANCALSEGRGMTDSWLTSAEWTAYVSQAGASAENGREDQEVNDRQNSPGRQGHDPRGKDGADHTQDEGGDTARHANPENRTEQGVRSCYRQAEAGSADDGGGRGQFGGKPAAGCLLGDVPADGGDHPVAVGRQTHHDAERTQQQHPAGHSRLRMNLTRLQHASNGGQRTYGIGHVIG